MDGAFTAGLIPDTVATIRETGTGALLTSAGSQDITVTFSDTAGVYASGAGPLTMLSLTLRTTNVPVQGTPGRPQSVAMIISEPFLDAAGNTHSTSFKLSRTPVTTILT